MNNNQIEEVKSKVDIVSLISEYIELKKAGRNYKANCPFHGEKTPSFMISPELQMYKCFGCSKSGDVFTFLQEHEGMEFGEALKYLADKVGVKLISFKPDAASEKEKIIEINKSTLNFYEYVLLTHPQGKKALEYLIKDRGLNLETIKKFQIGFSPESFNALPKYLTEKKNFKSIDLEKAGIIIGGGGRAFDRFRGRVIFPLFDHRGQVIGFAGRILPWVSQDMAKYINSPETPAYHKSKVLYGLNITKNEIRDEKYAIVVEGELDMISSYQAGIKNVIAIKGSALTEDQIRLIGRFVKKIILCLDSDFAGDEAAKRGAILAENLGFEVKVARLIGFKDPDEIARANPELYKKAIEDSIGIWDFLIDLTFKKYNSGTGEGKAKISAEIIPLISLIQDNIVKAHYIEILSRKLSVPVEAVTDEINKQETDKTKTKLEDLIITKIQKNRKQLLEERLLINAISTDPRVILKKDIKNLFSSVFPLRILEELEKYFTNNDKFNLSKFTNDLPKELVSGFSEIVLENSEDENIENIIKELKIADLRHKMEELGAKIRESEDDNDLIKLSKLQNTFADTAKDLSALEEE
ncbi:MAG: DNA primase [Candidatus Woesebacteria bacterium]|nr:DNA primase [Candidatus Woesebacteria bacterium]